MLKLLAYAEDFDMVCGTRTTRELIWDQANMGWFLRVGNWAVAKLLQILHGGPSLSDCGCTLRLAHRGAVERIRGELTVGGSHFLPEMVILALRKRLKVIEVPGELPRAGGGVENHRQLRRRAADRRADDRTDREISTATVVHRTRQSAQPDRLRRAGGLPGRRPAVPLDARTTISSATISAWSQLLAAKPAGYFPRWFVSSWMDGIWGHVPDEVRPFPALSYQLTSLGGAASPFLHHALNIALHAANGLVVLGDRADRACA